jgi:acyl-CoA thioester hydrolase
VTSQTEVAQKQAFGTWQHGWYVVPWQVIFRDLDTFGHVNNAVFLTYFELARTAMWLELTGGRDARDVSFIVARAECDFRLQLGLEPIDIAVRIQNMRTTSFDWASEIRKADGRQIVATGTVIVVLFDWEKQAKMAISNELRAAVARFQKED